jgi:hypothetical protein
VSVLERMDLIVPSTVFKSAPGAQEYPFSNEIGIEGSGEAEVDEDDAVIVLVIIVLNDVEDATTVVVIFVIVVLTTLESFEVELLTICSGHN